MNRVTIRSLLLVALLTSCGPAIEANAQGTEQEECIQSAKKYMGRKEAERFCKQSPDCRKWWDDLSEEERREIHEPEEEEYDPDWWMKCEALEATGIL